MEDFNPIEILHKSVTDVLLTAFPGVTGENIKFETPPDPAMGHFALSCFKLAPILKKKPDIISREIAALAFQPVFSSYVATGPYVNFFVNLNYLSKNLFIYLSENEDFGSSGLLSGKTFLIEFSAPNTNKPLHLGHGRNNTLGTVLSNLFEKCGSKVIRANLVNDRGVHICKSMLAYQMFGNHTTPESEGIKGDHFVGNYYVKYADEVKSNPDLENQIRDMLLKWENNDPEIRKLWKIMNEWVLNGFNATYQRTGVRFDRVYYEHQLYQGGKDEVLKALENGICEKEDNGAVSIDLTDQKLGKKILLRNDGTAIYMTQDIYTTIKKFTDYPLDGSLFVVGNEQEQHFRVLFAVLKKFGYKWAETCEHINYGMITLPEGRMKSRDGTVVDLDELLDTVKSDALQELKNRVQNLDKPNGSKLDETAEHIAQAAVKFIMLRVNAIRDFIFDPKESVSFEGATGPYLQYTHARICTILEKGVVTEFNAENQNYEWQEDEGHIIFLLAGYPNVIINSVKERNPAVLASYVYEVAKLFNKFYNACPILKSESAARVSRLNMCLAVKKVLAQSLILMTINPLNKM